MRRFLLGSSVAVMIALATSATARAQFHHHHLPAVATPAVVTPSVHHFAMHSAAVQGQSATVTQAAGSLPATGGSFYHHHHHQGQFYSLPSAYLFYPGFGYPAVWSSYYTPLFPAYYPPATYYFTVNNVVPEPQREARIIERANPAPEAPAKPEPKSSTPEQKARAGKMIALGDGHFAKKKYASSIERYRVAAQAASDLAEPYFRTGFAQVALGQYAQAAKSFRKGLAIRSDWNGAPFRLDQLYQDVPLAKDAHLEDLAKAVEANPWDANLLMVLGTELYFDGQRERARVFFSRAAQLGGNNDHLLDPFLPQPGPAGAQKIGPAKIVF